jgi:hypothetical protein
MGGKTQKKINNLNKKIKRIKSKSKMNNMKQGGNIKKCMCMNYEKKDNQYINYNDATKCTNNVKPGTDFCEKHQDCMGFIKSFMNNYELDYEPQKWNDVPEILNSHNCYTYFLNNQVPPIADKCKKYTEKNQKSKCSKLKPQPGDFSELLRNGTLKNKERQYTCPAMTKKVMDDNPSISLVSYTQQCPKDSYKGALVVDPNNTFHFYRQNKNGLWSHKPGVLKVIDRDASNELIYFPHDADRNYKKGNNNDGINYTDFCNYMCVPTKKSGVKIYSV